MGASDWLTLLATLIAAASFIWGVISWRAAYLGQKRIELAEQVYELTLNCIGYIREIRSPFGFVGEGGTRKREDHETKEESEIYDRAFVALERMNKRRDEFNKLFSLMPRFEFYFSEDATAPLKTIGDILHEIRGASYMLRHYWIRQGRQEMPGEEARNHLKEKWAAEAIFWDKASQDDPINPKLTAIAQDIRVVCKIAVTPQPNFWRGTKRVMHALDEFFRIPPGFRD